MTLKVLVSRSKALCLWFLLVDTDVVNSEFSDEEIEDDDSDDGNEDVDMSDSDEDETGSSSRPQMTEADRAARQEAMDKLVPGIDPSEYGRMPPSYHGNSQRVKVKRPAVEADAVEISTPGVTAAKSEPQNRTIRPPILPRDKYEGVDSDDETDEDDVDSEDEEDQPQVVGDVEIDMEAEEEEFIEFARQALGLTDDQWNDIVSDRKGRGGLCFHHYVGNTVSLVLNFSIRAGIHCR